MEVDISSIKGLIMKVGSLPCGDSLPYYIAIEYFASRYVSADLFA